MLETMSLTKQKNFQGSSPIELAVLETLITSKKSSIRTGFSHAVFCLLSCCMRGSTSDSAPDSLLNLPAKQLICLFLNSAFGSHCPKVTARARDLWNGSLWWLETSVSPFRKDTKTCSRKPSSPSSTLLLPFRS